MLELFETQGINCTGDACVGDVIRFAEGVFGGSRSRPRYLGERIICAEIIRDSYGKAKQQHTFTLKVLACEGVDAESVLRTAESRGHILRKGRNVYRNGTERLPRDAEQRQASLIDKHKRGDYAREARHARREAQALFGYAPY